MSECYARELGNCEGKVEEEHFLPVAIQQMLGPVQLSGFAWQNGPSKLLSPGSYAKSRMLCSRHHDELDGLDANARDYFQNWMLIAFQNHIATGEVGKVGDIRGQIDGRNLERWFLKTICGAIVAGTFADIRSVPSEWITALSAAHSLNGIVINAFGVQTLFSIEAPDNLPSGALRRPKRLGAYVSRPDGSAVLAGLPARSNVEFGLSWPA
jgi:hypothetical protein